MADSGGLSLGQAVALVFIIVTVSATGIGYDLLIHQPQQRIAAAEETNATVVSSTVERIERTGECDRFRPNITHRYSADGETYTNNYYLSNEVATFNEPTAQDRADTFEATEHHRLRQSRQPRPGLSLERGPRDTEYMTIGVLGLFAAGSLWKPSNSFRGASDSDE
jgi:hypothetical protein